MVRHSGARNCRVSVEHGAVEIADDGRGPGESQDSGCSSGHGLAGLRERVESAGAQLSIGRTDGGGFLLRLAEENGWLSHP